VGFKPDLPTGFLQCFDIVGLVIWPVKIVPEMTYNVLSWTLSLYTATTSTKNMRLVIVYGQTCWWTLNTNQNLSQSGLVHWVYRFFCLYIYSCPASWESQSLGCLLCIAIMLSNLALFWQVFAHIYSHVFPINCVFHICCKYKRREPA